MSGIVGSRLNIRGSGLVGSLGTDGQVFTSSGTGAGAVFEAASAFDDTDLRSDIITLALKEAITENRVAYNLPNSMIEQFQDDSKIGTETDGDRNSSEYWGTIFATAKTITMNGDAARSSTSNVGTYSMSCSGTSDYTGIGSHADFAFGTGAFTLEGWFRTTTVTSERQLWSGSGVSQGYLAIAYRGDQSPKYFNIKYYNGSSPVSFNDYEVDLSADTWYHVALVGTGGSNLKMFLDGTQRVNETVTYNQPQEGFNLGFLTGYGTDIGWKGFIDEFRISNSARYSSSFSTTTTPFTADANTMALIHFENTTFVDDPRTVANATGTLISTANTANASQTKVSGVILYANEDGTATLGTDLKIYFTCNGGTNWTESTPTAAGTFSSGILMAKCPEVTCTAGTDIRYKAVWANQSSGSKETRLHGIGMNY